MPKCADCQEEIRFDPMKKRTLFACSICGSDLCAAHGVLVKDGTVHKLPCRRCKSEAALLGDDQGK